MNLYKLINIFLFILANIVITNSTFAKTNPADMSEVSLSATITTTDATCSLCNGSIDLTTIGGEMPFTYQWSSGAITEDLEDLCLDFYTVTITDFTGCTFSVGSFLDNTNLFQVNLESQSEVNEFVLQYGDCTEILGSLRIGTNFGNGPSNISDISGLSNLTTIGSSLNIFQNPNLTSLSGLSSIQEIGFNLHFNTNNALTNLSGLEGVESLTGNLFVDNHTSLANLNGLNNLTTINDLYISNNINLTDISALSQLRYVNGDFDLRIAIDLTNLTGLEQLEIVGGDFILRDNLVLTDINALDHPITINGNVIIENTDLNNCSILPFCNLIGSTNTTFTLNNNNTGCNSEMEIETGCSNNPITLTMVGYDVNCFGLCDGYINLFQEGATPPFTYTWSTGASGSSPNLFDLCSGTYGATITDAFGITAEASYSIGEPDLLVVEAIVTSNACFGECVGEVTYSTSGGIPPYSTELADNLCADTYDVLVMDTNNCEATTEFTIIETQPFSLDVDQVIDNDPGEFNGSISVSVSQGTAPFSYSWRLNGTELTTDEDPAGLSDGTYYLTVFDAGNCSIDFGPFTVGMPSSTTDLDENLISIFPNPATDNIVITFQNGLTMSASYSLAATNGASLKEGFLENKENVIQADDLAPGLYLLTIIKGNLRITKKIVISIN